MDYAGGDESLLPEDPKTGVDDHRIAIGLFGGVVDLADMAISGFDVVADAGSSGASTVYEPLVMTWIDKIGRDDLWAESSKDWGVKAGQPLVRPPGRQLGFALPDRLALER